MIADLGTEFYDDPSLLTDPQSPVQVVVEDGVLRITASDSFTGSIEIRVTVSDGIDTVEDVILVEAASMASTAAVDDAFADWDGID